MAFCIRSLPRSMRRAKSTSPSRVSSGTAPISRKINPNRIVRIDRFFNLLLRVKEVRFLSRFGIKKLGIFLKRNAKGFMTLC